jgi:hypothetical protein
MAGEWAGGAVSGDYDPLVSALAFMAGEFPMATGSATARQEPQVAQRRVTPTVSLPCGRICRPELPGEGVEFAVMAWCAPPRRPDGAAVGKPAGG